MRVAAMNAIAGISGGRTSAMMAYLLDRDVVFSFQNTGREAAGTYDFIDRLEQDLGRPIVRLEYRAPSRGAPPREATFEVVEHRNLSRDGGPFWDMLECARSYRLKHKNQGPIAPWARQRICTAHLKIKTQRRYCASLGWGTTREYAEFIGLRADEPVRVAKMRARNNDRDTDERAPLADVGVTKRDVMEFWQDRPFDLLVPEHMGNCTGCFLKDEKDLATALTQDETDAAWWISVEETFAPMRRKRSSYRQVLEEAPARMRIRAAVSAGVAIPDVDLSPRRVADRSCATISFSVPFSCECDSAKADDFDDDDPPWERE